MEFTKRIIKNHFLRTILSKRMFSVIHFDPFRVEIKLIRPNYISVWNYNKYCDILLNDEKHIAEIAEYNYVDSKCIIIYFST